MDILSISIILFIIMELSNVIILYFKPEFKYGNGISVFKFYEESKKDEASHLFVKYMTNWVAGTKLIFILLLAVILFLGDEQLKIYAVIVMIISISTYYFRLRPIINKLDSFGKIKPVGYSKNLTRMITGFMLMFTICLIAWLILNI